MGDKKSETFSEVSNGCSPSGRGINGGENNRERGWEGKTNRMHFLGNLKWINIFASKQRFGLNRVNGAHGEFECHTDKKEQFVVVI